MTIGIRIFLGMLLAVVVCYLAGTIWYAKVYFNGDAALTLKEAAKVTVRPFIIPEIIKLIAG
ncbi:MAG: biotin transporter BioY, partial [Lachnospiraceae bacterium]|nr:biotin transporter BioY [Lachnospiraceae bacterium]